MADLPNVHLQLANRAENVMLVREVLTGVADALALEGGDLIDIHTAVTEACNNVVQHAYGEGEGPLDAVVELAPSRITVVVRDWGTGIPPHGRTADGAGSGIGLPVIRALAHRLELRRPSGGGTEVCMEFLTRGTYDLPPLEGRGAHDAPQPLVGQKSARPAIAQAAHAPTIALTIMPGDLARTILPRLMCGLAARAHFSTSRLSDVHLLADALGATDAPRLRVTAGVESHALELRIGPLELGQAQRLIAASSLDGLGSVIAKLVDRHQVESAASHEVLALRLTDRGRARDAGAARR
jgi:anti-sigma regulatory factor (Ser/Thr protein kinase)